MMEKKTDSMRKRSLHCCVPNCSSHSSDRPEVNFYTIPSDINRRELWLEKIQLPNSTSITSSRMYVCGKHFEHKYVKVNNARTRLLKSAVPTLHIPGNYVHMGSLAAHQPSTSHPPTSQPTTSQPSISEHSISQPSTSTEIIWPRPIKREPEDPEEYPQENKLIKIKEEPECLTVFVAPEDEEIQETPLDSPEEPMPKVEKRVRAKRLKRMYNTTYKMVALELYFRSPFAYRVLYNTFNLPRISALYRLCIPKSTELDQYVLNSLRIKADNMTLVQKQCVVCICTAGLTPNIQYDPKVDKITGFHEVDGVQILEPARTALVVMVRGLFHNWKQAIAFAFLSNFQNYEHVKVYIDEIITQLFRVGLNVRALMTDRESDVVTGAEQRSFNAKAPYIFVNERKVYYMYDPLYLMKNIRDQHLTHNYIFYSGLVARWHHIVYCYQTDMKKLTMRLVPKLSFNHIRPIKGALDELTIAMDIFSKTIATAISAYIDMKELPPSARDTVQWIITMSKLMDMFNFSSTNPPEDKSAVFSGEAEQVDFLVGMLIMFANLKMVPADINDKYLHESAKTSPAFVDNVRITINSILLLYGDMKTENCWYPLVGLTRDCLSEFFNKVRQKHGGQPTCQQMIKCINAFPIFNMFQYSLFKRRPNELEIFMLHARQMPDIEKYERDPVEPFVDTCADICHEFSLIDLPTENRLDHFSLYLLHKGYQQHSQCADMQEYTRCCEIIKNETLYVSFIPSDNVLMDSIPHEFVEFVEILDIKFKDYFRENRLSRSMSGLLSFIKNVTYEMPCACFPIDFVKQLYVRLRLHIVLKYNNKLFRSLNSKSEFVVNDL